MIARAARLLCTRLAALVARLGFFRVTVAPDGALIDFPPVVCPVNPGPWRPVRLLGLPGDWTPMSGGGAP